MQEMGAEIIANWGFWAVLRKPADEGTFELYSDVDSQIEHYTKKYVQDRDNCKHTVLFC